ncbi:hypothetical protein E1B28_010871 [Marasmius oreades]|uniref:Cytochrome P450 n=1 Tax=Marasmius oreades TaxID=181124 RepID=A0A9P7RTZ2_9AGAR|nr:uncharacterized protein E1B28_010871 [Marasmius oreades]KAG7089166.1 hypothetical protein E1B28_010871 [Marasmius oreades]
MSLPPGPEFVLKQLPWISRRVIVVHLCLRALDYLEILPLSTTVNVLVSILVQALAIPGQPLWEDFKMKRDAAARGAVLVPRVRQSSRSIMKDIRKSSQSGYIAYGDWGETYGNTYFLKVYSDKRMVTLEPPHIKAVLATQFNEFVKGPLLFSQWKSLLGEGVFNSDGDMWKFHRQMTRPFFSKDRIRVFEIFENHAMETINLMKERLYEGQPVDFQDAVGRFTLDSATEFLFGKNVRSLDAGLPYAKSSGISNTYEFENHPSNRFVTAFMKGQEIAVQRARSGKVWPLMEFWKDELAMNRAVVDEFVKPILANVKQREESRSAQSKEPLEEDEFFLAHLVRQNTDDQVILDELVNILVASRDTTASLLSFAVYVLTQRPDIVQRLREDVLRHVAPTIPPSYEDIKEMKYLRAFLNETLRLYPPVPTDSRDSAKATTLPNVNGPPIFVPEDTRVTYSVFYVHRREDLWGLDAHEFDPDRFLDERLHKYLTPNPFIFLPFNAGPRICLGQQFAYNEASFFLVRLLQNFSSFSFADDAQDDCDKPPRQWKGRKGTKGRDKIMLQLLLTMSIKGGLWVKMA